MTKQRKKKEKEEKEKEKEKVKEKDVKTTRIVNPVRVQSIFGISLLFPTCNSYVEGIGNAKKDEEGILKTAHSDDIMDASSAEETDDQGETVGRPQDPSPTLESVAHQLASLSETNQSVLERIAILESEQQKINERCKKLEDHNKELLKENNELRRQ